MSDVLFSCSACQQHLVVDAKGAGLTIVCPGCGGPVIVPAKGDTGLIRVPEADALCSRVHELEAALSVERRRAIKAEASLKSLTNRSEAAELTKQKVAVETQKTVSELQDSLVRSSHEIALVRDQAGELAAERDRLHASLDQATGEFDRARAVAADFQKQAKLLKTTLDKRETSLREAGTRLIEQEAAAERQQKDAVRALEGIGAEQEKTAQERDDLQKKLEALEATTESLRQRQASLQLEIEREEQDLALTRHDLAERTRQLSELKSQRRDSEAEREKLALSAAATGSAQEFKLLQQNREMAANRDRLIVELAEARSALQRTETQLYHSMSARDGLTSMVRNLRGCIDDTSELYHSMAATVDALEGEVQRLEAELRIAHRGLAA